MLRGAILAPSLSERSKVTLWYLFMQIINPVWSSQMKFFVAKVTISVITVSVSSSQ